LPEVTNRDPFWQAKQSKSAVKEPNYQAIKIPKNTPFGLIIGGLSFAFGFAVVWHIVWLVAVSLISIVICLIIRLSSDDTEYILDAATIKKIEAGNYRGGTS
jgi:cytochrome o ubiquinol oxidase subunit 1